MNRTFARYGRKNRHTGSLKHTRMPFEKRVALQTGAAATAFLVCFAISRADGPYVTPVKAYIAKALTVSTDVTEAGAYLTQVYQGIKERIPALGGSLTAPQPATADAPAQGGDAVPAGNVEEEPKEDQPLVQSDPAVSLGMVAQAAAPEKVPEPEYVLPEHATLIAPVQGVIKSSFGNREHPVTGGASNHTGIDIAGTRGTTIISAAPGKVVRIEEGDAVYGNNITVQHTPTLKTYYAHLDKIMVREGEIVDDNTKIGEMGDTGLVTGVHLHFGVLENDTLVDPEGYVSLPHG